MTACLANMFSLELAQPMWLALGALAAGPFVLRWWASRHGRGVGMSSCILQAVAILLVAAAMARPAVPLGDKAALPYLVLTDESASLRRQDASLPADLPVAVQEYLFAQDVRRAVRQAGAGLPADASISATHLSPALRLAIAGRQNQAGVVLITDGQWQDDWRDAARAFAATGNNGGAAKLMIVPRRSPAPDARLADLAASRTPQGQVQIRVSVQGNLPQRRHLRVLRRGQQTPLLDREIILMPGVPFAIQLTDAPSPDQMAVYDARIDGDDAFVENDSLAAAVLPAHGKTLVAASSGAAAAADAISLPGSVDRIALADAPTDAQALTSYSAIVLVGAQMSSLPAKSRTAIADYVRGGGGLLIVGSGPGQSPADMKDPLNQVAALVPNPFQRRPLALVVVLDASGSMGETAPGGAAGQRKFDIAREAVLWLEQHLGPADSLKVITYNDTAVVNYDSGSGPADFSKVAQSLRAVAPSGPTEVMPALAMAAAGPAGDGRDGLVLLVSDLLTETTDIKQVDSIESLLRQNNYRLSVVTAQRIGEAAAQPTSLDLLIQRLGVQPIERRGLADLAAVFDQFLRQSRKSPLREGRFMVRLHEGSLTSGLAPTAAGAYLLSAPQQDARVMASIASTQAGQDPILAIRQVALGRSVSLALPAELPAVGDSLRTDTMKQLISRAVSWARRPGDAPGFSGTVAPLGAGRLKVSIEAADAQGRPVNLLSLRLLESRDAGRGAMRAHALPQVAPGRYEAVIPAGEGPLALAAKGEGDQTLWQSAYVAPYSREFEAIGANMSNMQELADITGGRIIRMEDLAGLMTETRKEGLTALWPMLAAAALAMMLLDWAAGRILRRV